MKFSMFQMLIAPTERACFNMGLSYASPSYFLWDNYLQIWDDLMATLDYSEQKLLNDIDKNWDLTDSSDIVTSKVN